MRGLHVKSKRKRLENLEDWGMVEDVEEDTIDNPDENQEAAQQEIRKWLVNTTPNKILLPLGFA